VAAAKPPNKMKMLTRRKKMKYIKILGWYEHRQTNIVNNYGGWVVLGDWNLYKTLGDAKNAIDKSHSGCHKAEPRVIRVLANEEFVKAFAE
jgi:exonuclease III